MMKIATLFPLLLEINNSVDFFNLMPNAEEHNLEFVEQLNIAMYVEELHRYGNTVGLKFELDELVAELVKYFKK